MKKVLLILLVLVLLIAAVAVWFIRSLGVKEAAYLVPSNTVAFLCLPDLPRTVYRWPQTILAQIGTEPQVKAFLEKPLQYLTKNKNGNQVADTLLHLKPVRIFAAVVSVTTKESATLIGFQFWGGSGDYDAAMTTLRQQLDASLPAAATQTQDHDGDAIISSTYHGTTIYTAHHGHWGFLSNNPDTIAQALDRAAGRLKGDSLRDNPQFKESLGRLVKDPDFFAFVQPQSAIDTLLAVGNSVGAQAIPGEVDQLKKIQAVSAALRCDGPNLHDSVFVLQQNTPATGNLTHKLIKLTTKDTTAYFDFVVDLVHLFDLTKSPVLGSFVHIPALQNPQLQSLIPAAFGPEAGISVAWPEGDFKPHGVVALQVRDEAKAEAALQEFLTLFPQATITDLGTTRAYNFPSLQGVFYNPTLAITNGFLLIGLDPTDITWAISTLEGSGTLEKSPDFSYAQPEYRTANQVFGFVDSKQIFLRGYPLLRQILMVGAAVLPTMGNLIDSSKLPETTTIAKHLQPIIYAQTRYPDGYLIESKGPITMNQAVILTTAGAMSFFKPKPQL